MSNRPWGFGMNNSIGHNWLLLRGLSRESAHWGDFVPLLRSAFPKVHIHTLDLPGTGRFHEQLSPCRIEAILAMTRQQALNEGLLQAPVTLFGLSLGGMVAWEWMRQYPEDVCASVLINSSFANVSPFYQRLRWQSYGKFLHLLTADSVHDEELAIVRLVSNRPDQDRLLTALDWTKIHLQRPISFKNSFRQISAAALYRPDGRRPDKPVLLLSSLGDRLVSPACSSAMQQKWQLQLRSHPTAGHDLPLDAGDWVLDQLKSWVGTIG